MTNIAEILGALRGLILEAEDDEPLSVEMQPGASEENLQRYEETLGAKLPADLRELLAVSDGMSLFDLDIMSIDMQEHFPDPGTVSFHNWGNGDFDCVALSGSRFAEGTVLFMNHGPEVVVPVAPPLAEWLVRVVEEIKEKGALLHPGDYRFRPEEGLYKHVVDDLRGRDCELNR